jgi:hypothetical protein
VAQYTPFLICFTTTGGWLRRLLRDRERCDRDRDGDDACSKTKDFQT